MEWDYRDDRKGIFVIKFLKLVGLMYHIRLYLTNSDGLRDRNR